MAGVVDLDRPVVVGEGVVEDVQVIGVVVVEALASFVERCGLAGAFEGVDPESRPLVGGDEVAGWVGVPAGLAHPDLAGAQRVAQFVQDTQFPVVAMRYRVTRRCGVLQVWLPA